MPLGLSARIRRPKPPDLRCSRSGWERSASFSAWWVQVPHGTVGTEASNRHDWAMRTRGPYSSVSSASRRASR